MARNPLRSPSFRAGGSAAQHKDAVGAVPRGRTAAPHKDGRALLRLPAPKLGPAAEFLWAGGAGTSAQCRVRGARLVTRLFGTGL